MKRNEGLEGANRQLPVRDERLDKILNRKLVRGDSWGDTAAFFVAAIASVVLMIDATERLGNGLQAAYDAEVAAGRIAPGSSANISELPLNIEQVIAYTEMLPGSLIPQGLLFLWMRRRARKQAKESEERGAYLDSRTKQ